ncbi:MAG: transposase [Bacteroidales bacterium]|nr:transposase [Bacteroidales bacterium]
MNTKANNKGNTIGRNKKFHSRKKSNSQKKKSCKQKIDKFHAYKFTLQVSIVIKWQFPEFIKLLSEVSDYRKRPQYEVKELVMAVITMYLFKRGSRNHADNTAGKLNYSKNIEALFKMKLPDLDTADRLMKNLDPQEIEIIKKQLVATLISRKVLHKFRLFGFYYNVTVDGTGIHSYHYEPYPECPYKEYPSGKKVWTTYVLEAKIVCSNGFSLSIATEWVKNPTDKEFDKQDCELKAFTRLAEKIKKFYPRLPVCITADGLYPNNTVFDICKKNNWKYIITLKDGNLKTVWEEIELLRPIKSSSIKSEIAKIIALTWVKEKYTGFQDIDYKKHKLNIVEAVIEKVSMKNKQQTERKRFVHVTNFNLKKEELKEISYEGRRRWKIENEGFNEQKNTDYNLKHKYSRTSFTATQNYYQCLQIAHLLNQLAYKSKITSELITGNDTLKSHEEMAASILMVDDLTENMVLIKEFLGEKNQFRY